MGYNAKPYKNAQAKKYHQGYYKPINPDKYIGNSDAIIYRSGLELHVMQYFDSQEFIKKWNSEGVTVIWRDFDGASHRYYPDFYYEAVYPNKPDEVVRVVVEVKPHKETQPPVKPKNESVKSLTNHEYSVRTYKKNILKWGAAIEWCEKRGFKFMILTEQHLKKANIMK